MAMDYSKLNTSVLDHGFIRPVEAWGRGDAGEMEAGIIEAARQSTKGNFRGWAPYELCTKCDGWRVFETGAPMAKAVFGLDPACAHKWKQFPKGDVGLLQFLMMSKPQHSTPFEFAGLVIEVKAPIFVFREWHRHRTQSYNEMSARYTPIPPDDYLPTYERCMMGGAHAVSTTNKQAQNTTGVLLSGEDAQKWLRRQERIYKIVEGQYQRGLMIGIPKELARCSMVVARYSQMRAHANLRNWLGFLTLRSDKGAQWEIRQFAEGLAKIIEAIFPHTWRLFDLGRAS